MNEGVARRSDFWNRQLEMMELPNDLLGGTPAMRKAGQKYLRKGSAEHPEDYLLRLNQTTLTDAYKRTLNFLTGQLFQKEIILEGTNDRIRGFVENIDRSGNNLSTFCSEVFRQGLHAGVSFILVDFSKVETRTGASGRPEYYDPDMGDWFPRTEAIAQEKGWRPYWSLIKAEDVIDVKVDVVDGAEIITHFRYYEPREEWNDWATTFITDRIRVLTPSTWEIWERMDVDSQEEIWDKVEEGTMPFNEVPIAVFMPGEAQGDKTAIPALQGLAYLCETHWQATSGHRYLMDWVRRPAFFGKMLSHEGGDITFGPNCLVHAGDPSADLKSVGVDVNSVNASQSDIEKIESEMAMYGLRLLMPHTGKVTATQHILENAESMSSLKLWAKVFKDVIERAMEFTARWENLDVADSTSVVLADDFVSIFDSSITTAIIESVKADIVPKEMAFGALQVLLPIRDSVDWPEAKGMLDSDKEDLLAFKEREERITREA